MTSLFALATRRMSRDHFRYVEPVRPRSATGLVDRVYGQIEAEFGMLAPPLVLHAPVPATLAGTWLILREVLLAPGVVGRDRKEAVAAAVSLANRCPYCVDVHGTTLVGLLRDTDARAIADGRIADVADPGLQALVRWSQGGAVPDPAFPAEEVPELAGTALTFHYINRMVNIFLRDSPLPPVTGTAREAVRGGAARVLARIARREVAPGARADLLPARPLPPDLAWAAGRPPVADALARAVAAIDEGGARVVPPAVRGLLTGALADGVTELPLAGGEAWLAERTAGLDEADRAAARLVLLSAFGAYRVTDAVIEEYRRPGRDDAALVDLTSWASMTTARHLAAGLAETA
ncbi:carboxymuconolactone decarboxylase family protein [Dactylosporangium cerinum]|uniref:Carboxymuconolactone decarboxylase family protein n=1 Tax=Dactylosporangium cerinum TaxID=1434730 RepID=A0ABV9VS00_9ACTN